MKLKTFIVFVLFTFHAPVFAAAADPVWGRDGMIVTSVSPAAPVGQAILEKGGNAVDAAIAASFAASVAHPFSSGLGGGMFAVVHDADSGQTTSLDARETAPRSADPEFYRDNPDTIRKGKHSVGVPGLVQGLWDLHQRYGSMPWPELIEPAIELAENGVPVSTWHHRIVSAVAPVLVDFPETRRIQTVDGIAPPLGWILKQQDLAGTLRLIQEKGGKALAVGPIAKKIEEATDGVVTELDLARYEAKWREPVKGSYRGYEIIAMPPPSSGGVLLVEMLNVLQRYDLAAMGRGSGDLIHLVGSTMKLAFADRARHLGDPDYHDVPIETLTSMEYADQLAARLNPEGQPQVVESLITPPDDSGTTQITVLDRHGNAVSLTQTINTLFGSKITVPGTGVVLNNELDDFSIDKTTPNLWDAVGTDANAIEPGKRPLSSMTPLVVLKDGRAVMGLGSPMGTLIISTVLQALINTIDFDLDPQSAVMAPRFHHQWQPDTLYLEPEFAPEVRAYLESLGHTLGDRSMIGAAQLAIYDSETCYFWGAPDGRRDSGAAGANIGPVEAVTLEQRCQVLDQSRAAEIPR
ncbi:MAG TPA: gamma-glutamyltransferase [Xanthomonadales bacterium]|nr:gamma-glutamyltransferase [Xanthomonadales bacterium]